MAGKYVNYLVHFIHLALVAVTFAFVLVGFINVNKTEYDYINSLGDNWNLGPVEEITPRDGPCLNGEQQLLNDVWQGTMLGCDCSRSLFNFWESPITRGSCNKRKKSNRSGLLYTKNQNSVSNYLCYDIPPISPMPLRNWSGKNICGKRMPFNYLEMMVVDSPQKCDFHSDNKLVFKSCGIIDNLGNYLCVHESVNCPINNILVVNNKVQTPANYTSYDISDGKKIMYTNVETSGKILVEFKLSEGEPCMNPKYNNLNSEKHILENQNYNVGCQEIGERKELFDNMYRELDADDNFSFYNNNGVESLLKTLPKYKPNSNVEYTRLFIREYHGINAECKERILKDKEGISGMIISLLSFGSKLSSIIGWVFAALIISSVSLGLDIIVYFVCIIDRGNEKKKIPVFTLVIYFILSIIAQIMLAVVYIKIENLPRNYTLLASSCSVNFTNEILIDFSTRFFTGVKYLSLGLFTTSILLLFNFIFIILGVYEKEE